MLSTKYSTQKQKSKSSKKGKVKKKQAVLRYTISDSLNSYIKELEGRYMYMDKGEIMRMILSEKKNSEITNARKNLSNFLSTLPKPELETSEDDSYRLIEEEFEEE